MSIFKTKNQKEEEVRIDKELAAKDAEIARLSKQVDSLIAKQTVDNNINYKPILGLCPPYSGTNTR